MRSTSRSRAQHSLRRAVYAALVFLLLGKTAGAATIVVDTLVDENDGVGVGGISLRDAINEANSNGVDDEITFSVTGTINLTADLPGVTTSMSISGPGASSLAIDGGDLYRGFSVLGSATALTIQDVTISHMYAVGGNGRSTASGGGGGAAAGIGAALFANEGTVLCRRVTFETNASLGGDGGSQDAGSIYTAGAGGGGLGASEAAEYNGSAGGFLGGAGGAGACTGGAGGDGAGGGGSWSCGALTAGDGGFGGGAGGGTAEVNPFAAGDGATGGFGGGGGGGGKGSPGGDGGAGGTFGGNGGNGNGSGQGGGGGGAGLGGAVFARAGTLVLAYCTFNSNSATGGGGNRGGTDGRGKGGAVFVHSSATAFGGELNFSGNAASDDTVTPGDDDDLYGTITTMPLVSSITRNDASPTNAAQVAFTVTFNVDVTGVDGSDFDVNETGISGSSIDSVVANSPSSYVVTVSVGSGASGGTLGINVLDDDSILDLSATPFGSPGASNGDFTASAAYTILDPTPSVTGITRASSSPSSATHVFFYVDFDEAVSGVDATDFAIDASGVTGASITGVADVGSGSEYLVTVSSGSGSGTLSIDLIDDDSIIDSASQPIGGAGAGNGDYTGGETSTIDKAAPTVVSITAPDLGPTNVDWIEYTIVFSEAVTGFSTADFQVSHAGTAHAGIFVNSISATTFVVTINGITGDGAITVYIPSGAVVDDAGNPNEDWGPGVATIIDNTATQIVSVTPAETDIGSGTSVSFVVHFDGLFSDFTAADVVVNHAGTSHVGVSVAYAWNTADEIVTVSGISGTGSLTLTVKAGAIVDNAGNRNPSAITSAAVQRTEPVVAEPNVPADQTDVPGADDPNDAATNEPNSPTTSADDSGVPTDDLVPEVVDDVIPREGDLVGEIIEGPTIDSDGRLHLTVRIRNTTDAEILGVRIGFPQFKVILDSLAQIELHGQPPRPLPRFEVFDFARVWAGNLPARGEMTITFSILPDIEVEAPFQVMITGGNQVRLGEFAASEILFTEDLVPKSDCGDAACGPLGMGPLLVTILGIAGMKGRQRRRRARRY